MFSTALLRKVCSTIARFEGCRLVAYQDDVGVWTVGYGETLGVAEGMVWTQEQADAQLERRAFYFLMQAYASCPSLKTEPDDRVVACVSLEYNIGRAAFAASSVNRKTRRKDYTGAASSFMLWNKAGGRVDKGLTYRRGEERKIYESAQ